MSKEARLRRPLIVRSLHQSRYNTPNLILPKNNILGCDPHFHLNGHKSSKPSSELYVFLQELTLMGYDPMKLDSFQPRTFILLGTNFDQWKVAEFDESMTDSISFLTSLF